MAINCYCGLQGSGKSYEVVSSVLLQAVLNGRNVVTNVDGIDEDKIHEYLVRAHQIDPDKLGKIVHINNQRITEVGFFPDSEKPEIESIVKPGDLVCIDEAWRFWGTDNGKLSDEHMQFFRMHRHYVHPQTAVACDVALMTQDITGLHRSLKNVVEYTFRMQKGKSLGFSKCYRVDIHEGWKLNSKTRIDYRLKKYDSSIFPLYQSYAGGQGTEKNIDNRQNIFANRTLWLCIAGGICCFVFSFYKAYDYLHPKPLPQTTSDTKSGKSTESTTSSPQTTSPKFSENWRIAGQLKIDNSRWIVVSDSTGRLRLESPSVFHGADATMIGEMDGSKITRWTGNVDKTSASLGAK